MHHKLAVAVGALLLATASVAGSKTAPDAGAVKSHPAAKAAALEPWEPVDPAFSGCSEGVCGQKKASLLIVAALALAPLADAGDQTANTTLTIRGMTCGGCVAAVKVQLKKAEGVTAYEVSLEKGEAVVTYDPAKTEPKKIAESVSKTGFEAKPKDEKAR